MRKFKGTYSAIFSIYDEDMNINKESVIKLMEHGRNGGLKGFYVGGATGECVVLPNKTRKQMLETVMENKKSSQIIAHIGAGHIDDTLDLLEHANKFDVDAVASLPPALMAYYTADEVVNYYKLLSSKTDKPLMAYIQAFYQGDIVELAGRLCEIDNVIGIKLTVPNYYLFEKIRAFYPDINILNGPDETLLSGLSMGADGGIGTSYNLLPKIVSGIYDSYLQGDMKSALEKQNKLNRFIDIFFGKSVANWKVALRVLGIDPGYTVAPAAIPTAVEEAEFIKLLEQSGSLEDILK